MASIDTRLAALAAALERQKLEQETELDELSMSLYELEEQMCNLTEADIEAMAAEVDEDGQQIMTLEAAHAFVNQWKRFRAERKPGQQRRINRAIADKKEMKK